MSVNRFASQENRFRVSLNDARVDVNANQVSGFSFFFQTTRLKKVKLCVSNFNHIILLHLPFLIPFQNMNCKIKI